MGGIVTKRREVDASIGEGDVVRSEVELNGVISSVHQNQQHQSRQRGSEPFQRNQTRRVWSTNSNTTDYASSSFSHPNGRHQRPPLHPTRNSPPAHDNNNDNNNLSVDTSNNINSSNSTPRSAVVANGSIHSTPVSKDQLSLLSCINQTPVDDEKSKFQYYCPLCMRHFQETLVVSCCNNYICLECTIEFLGSKSIEATKLEDIVSQQSKDILKNISCPHCCQEGFLPNRVKHTDEVKNYTITPRACQCENLYNGMSPLKPGDSFEKMSQKMLKFDVNARKTPSNHHVRSPVVDVIPVVNADVDDGSEDSTSRRMSPTSSSPPLAMMTSSSLLGPEVDEENNTTRTPVTINTPMRRKVAVESYVEGILCEVCQSRAAVVC